MPRDEHPATRTRFKAEAQYRQQVTPKIALFFISIFLALCGSVLPSLGSFLHIPQLEIGTTIIWACWFGVMFAIAVPTYDSFLRKAMGWLKHVGSTIAITIAVLSVVEITGIAIITTNVQRIESYGGDLSQLAKSVIHAFQPADSDALTKQAVQNLLEGKNPYASSDIITAMGASPDAFDKITPLHTGRFSGSFPYPTADQLRNFWDSALTQPNSPPVEIESKFNYPAGSFLILAPFTAMGIKDIRISFIILALLALAYAAWRINPALRVYFIVAVALSLGTWNAAGAGVRCLYFPFLLMAWLLIRERLWLSALCMGIAVATKQVAWFFLPFYGILILRTTGVKKATLALVLVGAVFVAFNLPFIISNPELWVTSITAPMSAIMFPTGVGIITMVTSGVLHITSPFVFSTLELCALALTAVWYYRNCVRCPHTGLILALVPLFFAWRSLWNYFYYTDIVLLAAILYDALHDKQPL